MRNIKASLGAQNAKTSQGQVNTTQPLRAAPHATSQSFGFTNPIACLVRAALPAVLIHEAPAAGAQARHIVRRGRHALQGLAQRAAQRAQHRAAAAALVLEVNGRVRVKGGLIPP